MPVGAGREQAEMNLGFWAKLGLGAGGRVAKAQGLIARAQAESAANPSNAVALYTSAIDLLNSTQGLDPERRSLLGPAELGRGRLRETGGDTQGAVDSYLRARQLLPSLPLPALNYTAAALAKRGDASERAMALYLEMLRALKGKGRPSGVVVVYEFLERRSTIQEGAADRNDAEVALCRRLSAADLDLEWPHFYLGMDSLNRGQFVDAIRSFERCKAVRSTRRELPYYLAFSRGMERTNAREWEQAAAYFRDACGTASQKPDAKFWLGKSLVEWCERLTPGTERARYTVEAIGVLETATRYERRHREDGFYVGRAYILAERFSEAERWLVNAAESDPKNAACLLQLGLCRQKLGKPDKAADAARAALALVPKMLPAHRLLAAVSFAGEDYEGAQRHFQVVVTADPADHTSREQWGVALYSLRRWKEAIEVLRQLGSPSDSAAFVLARCHSQTDQFQEAARLLGLAAQKPSAEPNVFYYLGLAQAHLGQFQDAIRALDRALEAAPEQASWRLQRGHVHVKLGDSSKARADYEKAATLQPDNSEALYCLGRSYLAAGEDEPARTHLSHLVKLAPKHFGGVLALGSIYERTGALDSAIVQYSTAAALDPKNASARRCLGLVRLRGGDKEGAWKDLQQAGALGDDSDEFPYYCGLAAIGVGQFTVTWNSWGKLRERHPEDQRLELNVSRLRYLMGQEHAKAGRFAEASAEWGRYLEGRPEDEDLKRELAKLYLRLAIKELPRDLAVGRDALQKAAALDADSPVYRYYFALSILQEGKWDSFIAAVDGLLPQLDPSVQLHAKYHLAIAYLAKGEFDKADGLLKEVEAGGKGATIRVDTSLPTALLLAGASRWAEAADILSRTEASK